MKTIVVAVLTMLILQHRSAVAQDASESQAVVSGTGTVVARELPMTMRVSIQFKETGKDLAEALKTLKDRRAAASSQFVKLGASKESLREGPPALMGEDPQSARQMAMMMNHRGSRKKKAAAAKVTVMGSVNAEWSLPKGGIEELLLFVQPLKDKLNAADLAGQKEKKKLTAEEEEEQEEMELLQQQMGESSDAMKSGEPRYIFIARLSEAEQKKLRAAAFQKAREQAEQLAVASGRKLGKLRGLNAHGDLSGQGYNSYLRFGDNNDGSSADDTDSADQDDEGIIQSPVCGRIRHAFTIGATFDIE